MSKPQERDAEIMRHSLFGGRINLHNLIEVACTRSSLELHFIKQAYNSRFNSNLEQDMGTKLNSGFKEVTLILFCRIYSKPIKLLTSEFDLLKLLHFSFS